MKIYYENTEYQIGKKRILAANYDRDDFSWKNTINIPYTILSIDEIAPENKDICIDVVNKQGRLDQSGEGKYFINSSGQLCENEGWQEWRPELLL